MPTKPTSVPDWATGPGALITEPDSSKKENGFLFEERPAVDYFNWLIYNLGNWINWLAGRFNETTGHMHTGATDDAPPITNTGIHSDYGIVPKGGIISYFGSMNYFDSNGIGIPYNGSNRTVGWALCNGYNSLTPDMRSKFILGITTPADLGNTGGSTTHSHTVASHVHGFSYAHTHDSDISHTHAFSFAHSHAYSGTTSAAPGQDALNGTIVGRNVSNSAHTHAYSGSTDGASVSTGNTQGASNTIITSGGASVSSGTTNGTAPATDAQSNLPPYFKLAFIMKI